MRTFLVRTGVRTVLSTWANETTKDITVSKTMLRMPNQIPRRSTRTVIGLEIW
jgi:hypothetical protein